MKLKLNYYEHESLVGDSDSTSLNTSYDTFNFSIKCQSFNSGANKQDKSGVNKEEKSNSA